MTSPESWTHYERLGVGEEASEEEIKAAYRKLLRDLHPDHKSGPYQAHFDELTKGINTARDVLLDPRKRSAYDLKLRRSRDHDHQTHRHQSHRRDENESQRRREREHQRRTREEYTRQHEERQRRGREQSESKHRREQEEGRRAEEVRQSHIRKRTFLALLVVGMPLVILIAALTIGSIQEEADPDTQTNVGMQIGLPELDTSTRSVGASGPRYRMSSQEGGTMENGAEVRKFYVQTDSSSESDFKAIAEDISSEVPTLELFVGRVLWR